MTTFQDPRSPFTLCVVRPSEDYSQTFIDAHVNRLPARVVTLCCETFPTRFNGSRPLGSRLAFTAWRASRVTGFGQEMADGLGTVTIARFLRKHRVDVVLGEFGPTAARLVPATMRARIPLVAHFHGFDCYRRSLLESQARPYAALFRRAAGFVAVSAPMAETLVGLGAPPERVFVNPCGVDTDQFVQGNPACNGPVCLSVGRFVEKKAPHLALLAFSRVFQRLPAARLVMIGDGPLLDACRELARALGIEGAVEFRGAVPHEEVVALMHRSRVFLQHSVEAPDGDCEGTPVAILEAMACGLPVVATRHTGIVDVVRHGESGFLVNEFDCDGMAAHLQPLLVDDVLVARCGARARRTVESRYAMTLSIERLHRYLESLVGERALKRAQPAPTRRAELASGAS
jgi:colanic acid/amylovoran biosynthesis glycosyltransferase